jgi:hypothetical protein
MTILLGNDYYVYQKAGFPALISSNSIFGSPEPAKTVVECPAGFRYAHTSLCFDKLGEALSQHRGIETKFLRSNLELPTTQYYRGIAIRKPLFSTPYAKLLAFPLVFIPV